MFPEHLFFKAARITLLRFKPKYFLLLLATASLLGPGEISQAEVTLDGTMGASGALSGPDVVIPDTVGQTRGTNLFHSFGVFNINTGESATFTGPAVIDNVLSRVTGGSQSFIDGLLRSTIESANLWFINPSGVLFGEHASLDVDGSFHVSTADYLRLADGGRFEATHPQNSVITTAPPEAFGFLGEQPAGIAMQGSFLQVPEGETLSVVGGDIKVADGTLYAPGGRIDMASVASPGEVIPNASDLRMASFERLGRIVISHSSAPRPEIASNVIGNVDASGEGGGRIFIRGGELVAENAFIFADTRGNEESQGIDIEITGQVTLRNGARITADTFGPGTGGNLSMEAGSILLSGDEAVGFTGTAASAEPGSSGDVGDLTVRAGSLEVRDGAEISASTFGSGQGGNLLVEADRVLLSRDGAAGFTGIAAQANPGSTGDVGDLTVKAGSLEVREGAQISASTFGGGDGGELSVEAGSILLSGISASGFPSGIFAQANEGTGSAGNVTIEVGNLEMCNSAEIATSTFSSGRGGNLTVIASEDIHIIGPPGEQEVQTGLFSVTNETDQGGNLTVTAGGSMVMDGSARVLTRTLGGADAGTLTVNARNLALTNGAQIFGGIGNAQRDGTVLGFPEGGGQGGDINVTVADTLAISGHDPIIPDFSSGIFSGAQIGKGDAGNVSVTASELSIGNGTTILVDSFNAGRGGNITINATDIDLHNGGSISAESEGIGESGNIFIKALNNLRLLNGGQISVATIQADAGDINLDVGFLLNLRDRSSITTSVAGGTGDGGNITIDPVFTVLDGASEIIARAREGSGGNIRITTDFLFQSPDSRIDASSEFGVSGTVEIDSPDTDITGGITTLPESFFDAAALLRERCGVRAVSVQSSFIIGGGSIPQEPDMYLSASYFDVYESNQAQPVSGTENRAEFGLDLPMMAGGSLSGIQWGCGSERISSATLIQARRVADKET